MRVWYGDAFRLRQLIAEIPSASEESTLMAIVERFNIKVVASAGLCAAAIAVSPYAAAAPLITGGYGCSQPLAGGVLAAAGGPEATGGPAAAGGPEGAGGAAGRGGPAGRHSW